MSGPAPGEAYTGDDAALARRVAQVAGDLLLARRSAKCSMPAPTVALFSLSIKIKPPST